MESTGLPGYIQASSFTADLIIEAGRQNWVIARPDLVTAKGKGQLQTYWINPGSKRVASRKEDHDETRSEISSGDSAKIVEEAPFVKDLRLIEWTVDLLFAQLQKLVSARGAFGIRPRMQRMGSLNNSISRIGRSSQSLMEDEMAIGKGGGSILDEYTDIIEMPRYDAKSARKLSLNDDFQVELNVKEQLREYVTRIASMYRGSNAFHNFEHASHVAMAASKLLKRMFKHQSTQKKPTESIRWAHMSTYGISSDPLMQFTLVFAALIHDVDHTGLRNGDLVRMRSPAAVIYKSKYRLGPTDTTLVTSSSVLRLLTRCIHQTSQSLNRTH